MRVIDPLEKRTGIPRLTHAFRHSAQGLSFAWRTQEAFRLEFWFVLVLIVIALAIDIDPLHRSLLIIATLQVLVVELLNTAVEGVVDRVGKEFHVLSGAAKDVASAAVALSILACVVIWVGVLAGKMS